MATPSSTLFLRFFAHVSFSPGGIFSVSCSGSNHLASHADFPPSRRTSLFSAAPFPIWLCNVIHISSVALLICKHHKDRDCFPFSFASRDPTKKLSAWQKELTAFSFRVWPPAWIPSSGMQRNRGGIHSGSVDNGGNTHQNALNINDSASVSVSER